MSHTLCRPLLMTCVLVYAGLVSSTVAAKSAPQAVPVADNMHQEPSVNPADVASMDAIVSALYDVISGPRQQPRDWSRMRLLFAPGARVIPRTPTAAAWSRRT